MLSNFYSLRVTLMRFSKILHLKLLVIISISQVSLIYAGTKGVSISRNAVTRLSQSEYIWFLDIDCLLFHDINDFLVYVFTYRNPFLFISTPCVSRTDVGKFFKSMPCQITKVRMLSFPDTIRIIANAATYNIIVSKKYLSKRPLLRFDVNLGLGTYYHQSDEALFLIHLFISMIKSHSCSFYCYPMVSLSAESKSHLVCGSTLYASIESKGYVLAKSFSSFLITLPLLPLLSFLFAFKFRNFVPMTISIKCVVKGYIQGIFVK